VTPRPRTGEQSPAGPGDGRAGEGEWLTTGRVARRLGYSTAWVRAQIADGRLPARACSTAGRRSIRVDSRDLAKFVERFMDDAAPGGGDA